MEEARLRALLEAGEVDDACRLLYDVHGGALARFVRARRRDDADDVLQEVWVAVARALTGFRFETSPRGWLLTIARRKLIDAWRDRPSAVGLDDQLADDDAVVALQGVASSPRSAALRVERRAAVQRALATLDPDERELLELRYVGELTPAEIAELLDQRANTVSQRLVRALRRLRAALIADDVFSSRRGS